MIRQCINGYKVGPLFADNGEIAEEILRALAEYSSGQPIALDIPEVNPEGIELLENLGLQHRFKTIRMYTEEAPEAASSKIFGLTTLRNM